MKKVKSKKGYVIAVNKDQSVYFVFTQDEWSLGEGFRYPEWEAGSMSEAVEWIIE